MSGLFTSRLRPGTVVGFTRDQFVAWQKAQEALGRAHANARSDFAALSVAMQIQIIEGFVPAILCLLGNLGRERLVDTIALVRRRQEIAGTIETLAVEYHEHWTLFRKACQTLILPDQLPRFLQHRPASDAAWSELSDDERNVVREIVFQWFVMFSEWQPARLNGFLDELFG